MESKKVLTTFLQIIWKRSIWTSFCLLLASITCFRSTGPIFKNILYIVIYKVFNAKCYRERFLFFIPSSPVLVLFFFLYFLIALINDRERMRTGRWRRLSASAGKGRGSIDRTQKRSGCSSWISERNSVTRYEPLFVGRSFAMHYNQIPRGEIEISRHCERHSLPLLFRMPCDLSSLFNSQAI